MLSDVNLLCRAESDPLMLRNRNEFLKHEIPIVERDFKVRHGEAERGEKSLTGKIVGIYRRWATRNRHGVPISAYETIVVSMLNRIVGNRDPGKGYQRWVEAHELTSEGIKAIAATAAAFPHRPLISVFISVRGDVMENFLVRAIDSVRAQIYDNWELCFARDAGSEERVGAEIDQFVADDTRIRETRLPKGEFVILLDQHGELSRDAVFEIVRRINGNLQADLIYWDEDKLDAKGSRRTPFFKPDWSPDLILSMNYVGKSVAIRRNLLDEIGGLRSEHDAEQTYDLLLRAAERTPEIDHIPKVLYHQHGANSSSQQVQMVEEALRRRGLCGKVETSDGRHQFVRYEIRGDPRVSIMIPTRDKWQLLKKCIDSIAQKTDYPNYEIVILDNDSSDPATFKYFREVSQRARVLPCPGPFNFSAISNRGAAAARGDFLLFLNNDTEVLRPGWMRALIEQAQRPEVGAVGAKLLFSDGRIQHAGVVLGIDGVAGHAFRLVPDNVPNSELANVIRNCSAVTGACMTIRRSLFDQLGGFDQSLAVDFNDVDLCLRLRRLGYLIVYTPLALLHHHESATRRGFPREPYQEIFLRRWGDYINNGDPYYNRNLTLVSEDWNVAT
jgi:GT2 family glycosyltransferase